MDKDILKQYIDACEAVKETEEQIRRLQKNRKIIYGQQFWNCRNMCGLSWFSIIMTVFR